MKQLLFSILVVLLLTSYTHATTPLPLLPQSKQSINILGLQGQLWSEYLQTPQADNYKTFTRSWALSDLISTKSSTRYFESVKARLLTQEQQFSKNQLQKTIT